MERATKKGDDGSEEYDDERYSIKGSISPSSGWSKETKNVSYKKEIGKKDAPVSFSFQFTMKSKASGSFYLDDVTLIEKK